MAEIDVQTHENGVTRVTFFTKIVPGSSKTAMAGTWDRMLKIKVAAPPEKGKANRCVVKFLAKVLGVRETDIQILSGQTHPVKQIQVQGMTEQSLLMALFPDS
jgi:uncharacterized protein (TIGR00251 family)